MTLSDIKIMQKIYKFDFNSKAGAANLRPRNIFVWPKSDSEFKELSILCKFLGKSRNAAQKPCAGRPCSEVKGSMILQLDFSMFQETC
jgi:hypothetical protein